MSTLDTVLSFLQGKGLTPAQAAGVAGNLQVESGFDPANYNPREGAIGLAQWEGGRRQNLDAYAKATGSTETDLTTQLNYLWNELQGPERGALTRLQATTDPGSAAAVFDQYFERSSGAARGKRVAAAQAIAGGAPTATGPAAGAGGAGSPASAGASPSSSGGGLFGIGSTVQNVGLKILAGGAAAALVIVGAVHTVSK